MPPAKPAVVKKKKKKALIDVPPPPRSLYGPGSGNENAEKLLLEKLVTRSDLVFVRLKQADWSYSDFTVMVHSSAPLYTLTRKIEEVHGRVALDLGGASSLQLFRHPPNEKNRIQQQDWHLRLDQLGMVGGTVEEQHQAIIYYNYVPAGSTALLQREPQLMLARLSAEDAEAYAEQQQARNNDADFMHSMDMASTASAAGSAGKTAAATTAASSALSPASTTRAASSSTAAAGAASSSSSILSPRSAIGMAGKS